MTTINIDTIRAGDEISYACGLGLIPRATVTAITIARNAAGGLIPWLSLNYTVNGRTINTRIAATESAMIMYRVGAPL